MSNPAHSSPESFNLTTRPITDYHFFFSPTAALCVNSVLWELFIEGICWVLDLFSSQEPRKLFNVDDSEPLRVHMMVMNGTVALAVRQTALIYFTPLLRWVTEGRKTDWQKLRKTKGKGLIWEETLLLQENMHFTNWLRIDTDVLNKRETFWQIIILVTFG